MLHRKIADLLTNELFERFGSPSSAVIAQHLASSIMLLIAQEQTERAQYERRD